MILLESADNEARSTDRRLIFAAQLAARGHRVAISAASIEGTLSVHQRYQIAPFLADDPDIVPDRVVVLADGPLSANLLARLKSYAFEPSVVVTALGRFSDQQARIDCQNRLAYCLGREPRMVDLNDLHSLPLLPHSLMPVAGSQLRKTRAWVPPPPDRRPCSRRIEAAGRSSSTSHLGLCGVARRHDRHLAKPESPTSGYFTCLDPGIGLR